MMEEQNTELPFLTENGSLPTLILPPPVIPASQGSTGTRLKDSTSGFVGQGSPSLSCGARYARSLARPWEMVPNSCRIERMRLSTGQAKLSTALWKLWITWIPSIPSDALDRPLSDSDPSPVLPIRHPCGKPLISCDACHTHSVT